MAYSSVFVNDYKLHFSEKTTHIHPFSPGSSENDIAFPRKVIRVSFSPYDNRSQDARAEEAVKY